MTVRHTRGEGGGGVVVRRWAVVLVTGFIGATGFTPLAAAPAVAQTVDRSRTVDASALWADGTGDCNTGNRNAGSPTGIREDDFTIGASVSFSEGVITLHWRIATGGPFLGPVSGPVGENRTFELQGGVPQYSDAWRYTGTFTDRQMTGTFVRHAVYGSACTAQWKVTVELAQPLLANAAESEPGTPSGGAGEGEGAGAGAGSGASDGGGIDWLPIGVAGAGLLALFAWLLRWLRQRQRQAAPQAPGWDPTQPIGGGSAPVGTPAPTTGPGADVLEPVGGVTGDVVPVAPGADDQVSQQADPCDCTCTLRLEGPERLHLCDCAEPSWRLRPMGIQDLDPANQEKWKNSPSKASLREQIQALEAVVPDGATCPRNRSDVAIRDNVLFSRLYEVHTTTSCSQGGQASDIHWSWSLDTSRFRKGEDSTITLIVVATGTVACPNGTHQLRCETRKEVSIRPDRCRVYVVINKHPTVSETGHGAVRIVCGEFDRIYGYFPRADGIATIVPHPAEVKVKGKDSQVHDFESIDDYYPAANKWSFEVPCTCAQATEVQDYWERLRANPGRYGLANNNCATQALESVKGLLPPLPADASVFDKTPTLSPAGTVTLLKTLGLKHFETPPKIK